MIMCVCPRKRRKLKVYGWFSWRPFEYAYGAAYTKLQFARLMGSNLYILGGSKAIFLEEDPRRIKSSLAIPFRAFYDPNPDLP